MPTLGIAFGNNEREMKCSENCGRDGLLVNWSWQASRCSGQPSLVRSGAIASPQEADLSETWHGYHRTQSGSDILWISGSEVLDVAGAKETRLHVYDPGS
ncbi:hypothetical protein J6590_039408 [Homalodisca vitripennis]|nr:hypothetical protein J6590_039408 [Homalodisca vitripennis]